MWTDLSFFVDPILGGCAAVSGQYSKAHGRLYQIPKWDPDFSGKMLTGYRANADGSNWCYFDGQTCHDTETNTAIGVAIDHTIAWLPKDGEPPCSVDFIATAINMALQKPLVNLPLAPAAQDDCIAYDFSTQLMTVVKCDSGYDAFSCERLQRRIINLYLKNQEVFYDFQKNPFIDR